MKAPSSCLALLHSLLNLLLLLVFNPHDSKGLVSRQCLWLHTSSVVGLKDRNGTRVSYNEYALFSFYKNKRSLSRNTGIQEKMWKYLQFDRLVVNSQQESQQ